MRRDINNLIMGFLIAILLSVFTGCGGGGGNDGGEGETPVATEVWVGENDQGNTNTTLNLFANGTIRISGQWTYNYQGAIVTCQISAGDMTITGSTVTLTGTGTATNPAAPAGYQTSPFALSQSGTMSGGQGSGSFTITFQTMGWPSSVVGNWSAQIQSGGGITVAPPQGITGTYTGTFTSNENGIGGSYGATLVFVNEQNGALTVHNVPYSYYDSPVTVSSVNISQVDLTFKDKDGDTIHAVLVREGTRLQGSWHYQNAIYIASGQIDVTKNP